jgi:hypothetical protein
MTMLEDRCAKSLKSLVFSYNTNMSANYYFSFFAKFKNLTQLNVCGSIVDDIGFASIGEHCIKLVELNAGSTYITNNGIKNLCIGNVIIPGKKK